MSQQKTVLVIDDELDTLTYFTSVLEDHGYAAISARNGEEGLRLAREHSPDLVTLDVTMPGSSGVKCYRGLKESDELRGIPVIIITGISDEFRTFISSRRQVPPPEGYLSKPIDQGEFLALVSRLCGASG